MNKYTSNSSKGCIFGVDLEYSKELQELNSDYTLAPDKIEIKRKMLFEHQLEIGADLYNIPTVLKNQCLNFLVKKVCASLWKLTTLLNTRIKTKKYFTD